jgi:hypothetical protein
MKISNIIQIAATIMPSTSPATAIPLPLRLGFLPVWLMAIAPKIMAKIDKKLMKIPMIPRTREAMASPLFRAVASGCCGAVASGCCGTVAVWVKAAPHLLQKLLLSGFCWPHLGQYICGSTSLFILSFCIQHEFSLFLKPCQYLAGYLTPCPPLLPFQPYPPHFPLSLGKGKGEAGYAGMDSLQFRARGCVGTILKEGRLR